MGLKDWRNAGYQIRKGFDDYDRDLSIIRIFFKLFTWILVFGIVFVVGQTVISWVVGLVGSLFGLVGSLFGLVGPLVGIVLVGYIVLKVLSFFMNR